ncbi:MAG: 5-(carboxyamino)imidazole ribonucleotide mutase [Deltaproteobacteria bacterium]|nr:5-(carboxyamino)imidazole ribonucleotide mutase [Deltaproteobacteria bacterium]MBW2531295.1 5-(carboxyamino)imidazole ribonucleotide mutase [Deltaproteobacteria bacterium]
MGSDSDFDRMTPAWQVLRELGIESEVRVASAHRTPDKVVELTTGAREAGIEVIVAGAGLAAHLAGVIAAHTTLPIVAMPVAAGTLGGVDALLSSVQMPPGIPVAAVGIGGAMNAGLFAAAIIGSHDATVAQALADFRAKRAAKVAAADEKIQAKLKG